MKIYHLQTIVLCLFGITNTTFAEPGNWPQWRGPNGTGETAATDVVSEWGPTQNVKWRIELPEAGNSSPVVWNDKIFYTQPLTSTNQRALFCVDRETGSELWQRSVTYTEPEASHKSNPFCSASPVTDGERVIAWFGSAGLICWDINGNELWRRDLGTQQHMWGYSTSPIIHDDLCILLFGPGTNEFLIAVDKTTGETKWQVDALDDAAERAMSGPENDGNANDFTSDKERHERLRGAWSTPILVDVDGHTELVVLLPRRITGFNPATGELLWNCGGAGPLAYASPIESDGVVVVFGGYGGASFAVRAGGRGDVTQTHRLWHRANDGSWLGTGVVHDGAIYICDIGGVVHSVDVQSGKELWKGRADGGGTWSSITKTGDGKMFLLTKAGTTTVFAPDRTEYKKLAVNRTDETTNASVVVAGDDVLVRTDQALWSFSKK